MAPAAWCSIDGAPRPAPSDEYMRSLLSSLLSGSSHASPDNLTFPDPSTFCAGGVNSSRLSFWEEVVAYSPSSIAHTILPWIREGVK
ncbi:hypothetical protein HDU67_004398, partial [Dinochytrium kinnereticum]